MRKVSLFLKLNKSMWNGQQMESFLFAFFGGKNGKYTEFDLLLDFIYWLMWNIEHYRFGALIPDDASESSIIWADLMEAFTMILWLENFRLLKRLSHKLIWRFYRIFYTSVWVWKDILNFLRKEFNRIFLEKDIESYPRSWCEERLV